MLTQTNTKLENGVSVPVSGTAYVYDDLNRCIKETLSVPNETDAITLYAYNPLGEIIYEKSGNEVTRTLYDKYNRVIQEIEPQDYSVSDDSLSVNSNDVIIGSDSYSNANVGQRYVYDINTRLLTQEINRLEVVTDYTYHTDSSVVATETFDIYRYEYNTDGNLTDIFVANTATAYAHYVYDTDKNNTEIHYGNGQTVYYSYDSNKNVTAQSYTGRNETTPETQFTYTYNTDNELTSKTDCLNNRRTDYSGNTVSVYDISGNSDVLLYSYANTEENTSTNTPATAQNNYAGNTLDVTYGDNTNQYKLNNNDVFSINSTYTNDVLSSTVINNPSNQAVVSKSFTYGNDNNVMGLTVNNTQISYVYDDDKIKEYHQGNNAVYYHYDRKGQLEREDINYLNYSKTITYSYDIRGNLTKKKEYPYTRNENPGTPLESNELEFEYEDELWLDEIVTTPTETILYDENGNPVNLEDCTLEWTNGRQLKSVSNGNDVILEYTYDDNGIRTSKTYQGVTTYYCTENGVITSQYQLDTSGNKENEVIFIYDNGSLVSAYYNSAMYYYITNAMGDVISIIDENGNTVVDYCYDGWGNVVDKVVNTTLSTDFATINPMLYRSYYYDEELGVYYLQSRYYKSDWCRFINSDLPMYAQECKDEINGLNLFAYCGNKPVNNIDSEGFGKKKKVDPYSLFLDNSTISSKYNILQRTRLKKRCLFSSSFIESTTYSYACAVVALTEVVKQNNYLINNTKDSYNQLWDSTSTIVYDREYKYYNGRKVEICYGETVNKLIPYGIKEYAYIYSLIYGKKIKVHTKTKNKSNFSFFKNSINDGLSSTLSLKVKDLDGKTFGHAINVIGYCICKNKTTQKKHNFLIVADGWHNSERYIEFPKDYIYYRYGVSYSFEVK